MRLYFLPVMLINLYCVWGFVLRVCCGVGFGCVLWVYAGLIGFTLSGFEFSVLGFGLVLVSGILGEGLCFVVLL